MLEKRNFKTRKRGESRRIPRWRFKLVNAPAKPRRGSGRETTRDYQSGPMSRMIIRLAVVVWGG
jgi:hypothetical protein